MISAQEARARAEDVIVARRSQILKVIGSAIGSAVERGEMSTEVEEPEDPQVLATLRDAGFTVDYFDDEFYHIFW